MLTQTRPCPPPDAGVALVVAVDALVFVPGVGLVFGLNREPTAEIGFAGLAEAAGVVDEAAVAFLRVRCSAGEGDGALAAGEGLVSAFLWVRCLAGDEDALGEVLGLGD